jgi:vacuolar protein sorting-associated protein 26
MQSTDKPIGETIPIRLFLGGFDLTPTFRDVNKKYSTRYYLSLVLIDEGAYLLLSVYVPC